MVKQTCLLGHVRAWGAHVDTKYGLGKSTTKSVQARSEINRVNCHCWNIRHGELRDEIDAQ